MMTNQYTMMNQPVHQDDQPVHHDDQPVHQDDQPHIIPGISNTLKPAKVWLSSYIKATAITP